MVGKRPFRRNFPAIGKMPLTRAVSKPEISDILARARIMPISIGLVALTTLWIVLLRPVATFQFTHFVRIHSESTCEPGGHVGGSG